MSYERLAYDDPDSAARMSADCVACSTELRIPAPQSTTAPTTGLAPAAPFRYADFPHDVREPEIPKITVSAAAAHLASALHLHLD